VNLGHASAHEAAQAAARDSYGRLLAWLAWQWRDIAAAEDALADAFVVALERWPLDGIPQAPEAWLMTTAKRNLLMVARRKRLAEDPALTILWPSEDAPAPEPPELPDDRLRLMFVCTHPAIAPDMRCALMLQTVLGVEAARIASAFLVSAEAMTKRLTRVKTKIKTACIRFEEPGPDELAQRMHAVLEAIYGAYALHWGHAPHDHAGALADEALFLAQLVAATLPQEAEALGLLALLMLCEARKPARLDAQGEFVPLDQQDTRLWNHSIIEQANQCLVRATRLAAPGPYQLEAAIQAAHCHRAKAGHTPWSDIVVLYERLLQTAPTIGAQIGHAMATAQATNDPAAGLRLLASVDAGSIATHQPWWASCAHLRAAAGQVGEAAQAYARSLALTAEPALRRYLSARMDEMHQRMN
jgi:RNA polymerase sigma-70 factor (ECF subfamily)